MTIDLRDLTPYLHELMSLKQPHNPELHSFIGEGGLPSVGGPTSGADSSGCSVTAGSTVVISTEKIDSSKFKAIMEKLTYFPSDSAIFFYLQSKFTRVWQFSGNFLRGNLQKDIN